MKNFDEVFTNYFGGVSSYSCRSYNQNLERLVGTINKGSIYVMDVDFDYTSTYDNQLETEEVIYPNPTNGYVTITGIQTVQDIDIYDLTSNLVLQIPKSEIQVTSEGVNFSVRSLRKGTYFIRIGERSYKLMKN